MKHFLKNEKKKTTTKIKDFSNVMDISKLFEYQVKLCEEDLTEKDLYKSLKSMQNGKSPENDGLTKEFYETLWDDLKEIFTPFKSITFQKVVFSVVVFSQSIN